jgi:hypothetical protein
MRRSFDGRNQPDVPECSFCHKKQEVVAKLISSPSDYPRAYICDECVAVCTSILQDDGMLPPSLGANRPSHCLMCHPMAPVLLDRVEQWVLAESLNRDPAPHLDQLRQMARTMLGMDPA